MRTILVTGATSMIGTALVTEALARETEVYALIRPDTARRSRLPASKRLHVIEMPISAWKEFAAPPQCDAFYHFAWSGALKSLRNDAESQAVNIRYTLDAVELAHRCGARKFIASGSQAEYGRVDGVIDDDTRFAPSTAYGASKYAAGLLSAAKCADLGIIHIWGRVFSVYGPHDNAGTMLDYGIKTLLRGERAYFSAASQRWDYLYERDAGKLFYLLGERIGESRACRIARGESRPLKEYIRILAEQLHAEALCQFAPPESPPPQSLETDTVRLFADLGYTPETPFAEGISRMISAYRKHPILIQAKV